MLLIPKKYTRNKKILFVFTAPIKYRSFWKTFFIRNRKRNCFYYYNISTNRYQVI